MRADPRRGGGLAFDQSHPPLTPPSLPFPPHSHLPHGFYEKEMKGEGVLISR